jgi:ATP-dependent helicase/nuclease subunit B
MPSRLIEAADAGRIVLTPSAELGAALSDAVERAHRRAGREIWPTPKILDFGTWLKAQHLERQLMDSSLPRCLSDAEERELWRRVVLESAASAQFLEPSGAARAARRARRATFEYGIPRGAISAYGTEETEAFEAWRAAFESRCRELRVIAADELLGGLDRPDPPRQAADGDRRAVALTWIESPLWRPVARRWLERNAGAPLLPEASSPNSRRAVPRTLQAASPAAELAALAEWARAELEAQPSFRAWVCFRDLAGHREEVVDALDAALAPQRFSLDESEGAAPYAVAGGTPLSEHAPVRAALDLLTAAGGRVPFERFSALLRAPQLQASRAEASAAARLDTLLRSRAPSEATLREWLSLAEAVARGKAVEPPAALARLRGALRVLEGLQGHHRMSRWLSIWIEAFEEGPWSSRARWSSAEFQSAVRFRELLETLALGDRTFESLSRRAAESILERAARDTPFQIQTGVPPIWVSNQLSDPWLAYDGIWVTGCDESRWPPPVDPIALIPPVLQRQHGVIAASAEAQLAFAADLQSRWSARARAGVFSCSDPGEGRHVPASPLLAELAGPAPAPPSPAHAPAAAHAPAPALESAVSIETPSVSPPLLWLAQQLEAPAFEELADERAPAVGAEEGTRGVATLRAQSQCPFRGFAETRLDAHALEQPVPGFNERERGQILHDALQGIFTEVRDSRSLQDLIGRPEASATRIADHVRRAVEKQRAKRDPGERWVERERRRLQGLLERWLELESLRAPFEVEHIEGSGETALHGGLIYRVRIDRIDRLEDGSRILIDYKTGWVTQDWRGERPDNPQLPMYALLHRESLAGVAYGRVSAAKCCFVVESARADIFPGVRASRLEGMASFAELLAAWERRVESLAQEFARGAAQVAPKDTACRYCRLQGLCRVPSTLDALEPFAAVVSTA